MDEFKPNKPNRFSAGQCPSCHTGKLHFPERFCSQGCPPIASFVISDHANTPVAQEARQVALDLSTFLAGLAGSVEYTEANALGASSSVIQALIESHLKGLDFVKEVASRIDVASFRADFVKDMENDAILVEVERGKTIDNNMDMLDFWKCHIHPKAHHLILAVPVWYSSTRGRKATFTSVVRRMRPMFTVGNFTNVWSLHVVGY